MTDQTTIAFVLDCPNEAAAELDQLRKVQAAALRVDSSRRNGVVTDTGALDRLSAVLEAATGKFLTQDEHEELLCSLRQLMSRLELAPPSNDEKALEHYAAIAGKAIGVASSALAVLES